MHASIAPPPPPPPQFNSPRIGDKHFRPRGVAWRGVPGIDLALVRATSQAPDPQTQHNGARLLFYCSTPAALPQFVFVAEYTYWWLTADYPMTLFLLGNYERARLCVSFGFFVDTLSPRHSKRLSASFIMLFFFVRFGVCPFVPMHVGRSQGLSGGCTRMRTWSAP